MYIGVKHNCRFFALFLLITFLPALSFAEDKPVEANVEKPSGVTGGVSIPPPLEGVPVGQYTAAPQNLETGDITIVTSGGKEHVFTVELALTPRQQSTGMMFRDHVEEGTGMLFVFEKNAERSFWMKNTLVPLDIIFVREDGIIHNIHYMAEPKSLERISSDGAVMGALEIAGGAAEQLNINIGDRIVHKEYFSKIIEK